MTGSIKVQDLAQAMSKDAKELLFELQSIGVKVQSVEDTLPADVVQALLTGQSLDTPRQVIVRDDKSAQKKVKKSMKKIIPRVSVKPQKEIPIIDIPQKSAEAKEEKSAQKTKKAAKPPTAEEKKTAKKPVKTETVREKKQPTAKKPAPARKPAAEKPPAKPTPVKKKPDVSTQEREAAKTKEAKEARKPVRKKTERKKTKTTATSQTMESVDIRKFVGSSSETAKRLQEAEEQRSTLLRGKKRKAGEEEEVHIPLTLDEQVNRLKSSIPEGKEITVTEGCQLRDIIDRLGVKVKDFMPYLFKQGIILSVNQPVSEDFINKLSKDLGFSYTTQTFEEKIANDVKKKKGGTERAPIVTVMGHVDHGKTSILDSIRKSRVAPGEAGGITQHIGAYRVEVDEKPIVFIDTPGHEAFTQMRSRGARVTDIVVLVVAADDGIMQQTVEAINHTRAAGVPMIVAINKVDKANADPDRVKKQLADRDLLTEDWGGEVIAVPLSAVTGEGIEELLEMILLVSEMQELKADASMPAQGTILEARKETGRGIVATVLVQEGTLSAKNYFICGNTFGKVRAMYDDRGREIKTALPATPVEVIGFEALPFPGDLFQIVANEKEAKRVVEHRRQQIKDDQARKTTVSLEDLFSAVQGEEKNALRFVVKADVTGTLEVVKSVLESKSSDEVDIIVLHEGAGTITVNDVSLAQASEAIIIGFNVKPERMAQKEADLQGVEIRLYNVIYDLIEDVDAAIAGAIIPETREVVLGSATVLKVFKIPKTGTIVGSLVNEGIMKRGTQIRVIRDNTVLKTARIVSLKRFTEDVTEVKKGYECGIGIDRPRDIKEGDVLECFERQVEGS